MNNARSTHERAITIKILVGKRKGKRPILTPGYAFEHNIKIDSTEIGLQSVHWIHMTQDRNRCLAFVNTVMNL
jgi:hypothetical protein